MEILSVVLLNLSRVSLIRLSSFLISFLTFSTAESVDRVVSKLFGDEVVSIVPLLVGTLSTGAASVVVDISDSENILCSVEATVIELVSVVFKSDVVLAVAVVVGENSGVGTGIVEELSDCFIVEVVIVEYKVVSTSATSGSAV